MFEMQQPRRDNRIRLIEESRANESALALRMRRRLEFVLEFEAEQIWVGTGHRNLTEFIASEWRMSRWHANRLITAAHRIDELPQTDAAFTRGDLSLEHVVELCRFATSQTERELIAWARRVKPKAVRRKADQEIRRSKEEAAEADRSRFLNYWWMNDGRLGIEAVLPAAQGAVVVTALDRIADRIPDIVDVDEESNTPHDASIDMRRADALYALASARLANDQDADRATVVVHAPLEALAGNDGRTCWIENGPAIPAETSRRLACDARIEFVLHNDLGDPVGVGKLQRTATPWMKRALKERDQGCKFFGCECNRFLHAHHIDPWPGPSDLENMVLLCTFHHKLVHEYGWKVELLPGGFARWFRPDGRIFDPGPDPPEQLRVGEPEEGRVRPPELVGA